MFNKTKVTAPARAVTQYNLTQSQHNKMSYKIETVKLAARGEWPRVFGAFNTDLLLTHSKHQPCPACGGTDRFRFFPDWEQTGSGICNQCGSGDGFFWVQKMANCNFYEALKKISHYLGCSSSINYCSVQVKSKCNKKIQQLNSGKEKLEIQRRKVRINQVIQASMPLQKSKPAINYLYLRGLGELVERGDFPDNLGAVSSLPYWNGHCEEYFPAIVATISNANLECLNIHRTYLSQEGSKAQVQNPKKLMTSIFPGAIRGAAIRLYKVAGDSLALTEGIETALAVRIIYPELPVWATVSAGGLSNVEIPDCIKYVYIFSDKDRNGTGQKSAEALAKKLRNVGVSVEILLPPIPIPDHAKSVDWLDVLNLNNCVAKEAV